MKGRSNYLCRNKLYALLDNPLLNGLEEIEQFHNISAWEKTTETGDRAEIDMLPETSALWHKLDARTEVCLGQSCPDWERCFITSMRRKALESEILALAGRAGVGGSRVFEVNKSVDTNTVNGAISMFEYGHSDSRSFSGKPDWKYIRVKGLGLLPGTFCPHVLGENRLEKFAKMMKQGGED